MDTVKGVIVVDPFLVHSTSSNLYLLHLIAVDINRQTNDFLTRTERYDELKSLKTYVHNNAFVSIVYTATRGVGVRLPIVRALKSPTLVVRIDHEEPVADTIPTKIHSINDSNEASKLTETANAQLDDPSFAMYKDIMIVSERIMDILDDKTVGTQARNIAQYLLKCENMKVDEIMRQLEKPKAKDLIEKLLDCSSDLLSSDPRALGVDISNCIVSEMIQNSLDVKAMHTKNSTMTPKIKHTILHSHPTSIWIRFYSEHPDIMNAKFLENNNYHVITLCQNVYEFYIYKSSSHDVDLAITSEALKVLERYYDADIIFCSELPYFAYNKLLFISNYVKFAWCYLLDKQIFNPSTTSDFKTVCVYMIHSLLFLYSSNLAHMSTATHNPLIAYTGERPRTAINKFDTRKTYRVEGHRAMMTMGKSGDLGSKSNYIEIINEIELDHSTLSEMM